MLLRKEVRK